MRIYISKYIYLYNGSIIFLSILMMPMIFQLYYAEFTFNRLGNSIVVIKCQTKYDIFNFFVLSKQSQPINRDIEQLISYHAHLITKRYTFFYKNSTYLCFDVDNPCITLHNIYTLCGFISTVIKDAIKGKIGSNVQDILQMVSGFLYRIIFCILYVERMQSWRDISKLQRLVSKASERYNI